MTSDAPTGPVPQFVTVGGNPARAFGMDAAERARALAIKAGLDAVEVADAGRSTIYADLAWAWDPAWLAALADAPGRVLVKDGHAVLAHVAAGGDAQPLLAAMHADQMFAGDGFDRIDADSTDFNYDQLRKRDRPFVMRLDPADPDPVERAAYDAATRA